MLQSKIQSARCNAKGAAPTRGARIRDYALHDVAGKKVEFSAYRGKYNLVIVFCGDIKAAKRISDTLAGVGDELSERDSLALVVVEKTAPWNSGSNAVLIASDAEGVAHREVAAEPDPKVFITDKFGEVYASLEEIPAVEEILRWLDFINNQCPECEPPEWPAV